LKILRISTVGFFITTQLLSQIKEMVSVGAKVHIASSDDFINLGFDGYKYKKIVIKRKIDIFYDFLAVCQLYRYMVENKLSIVHSTTPKAGLLTAVAAFFARVPIRLHTFTGQPWVGMTGLKCWLARRSDWVIAQLNTCCYADSNSQCNFLIKQKIITPEKLRVIGAGSLSGVDLERFDRKRFSVEECAALRSSLCIPFDAEIILFVGRITVEKGVRELLEAFRYLKKSGARAHLILVGPFDVESGAGGVFSLAEYTDIPDVHFLGYSEVPEKYMAIADVFCLPSYREGFGTVAIEAAAMSLPTVGSNIYGLSDAILDGETGILVTPRDSIALSLGLDLLLSDIQLRTVMGGAARQRAIELFDGKIINALIIDEYRRLLYKK
jgi:glycosyltransferase involved in cell wall biosynthesis